MFPNMSPRSLALYLRLFPVFFAEDLGEEGSALKNPEKIGEEVDDTNNRFNLPR